MTSPFNLYRNTRTGKEIDLRDEIRRTLYGATDEIAKGRYGLLRKMREDNNGDFVKCPCRNTATTEPDRDFVCRYCYGTGYFWDEYRIVYYRNNAPFKRSLGQEREFESTYFYIDYNATIKKNDYIVEVTLNNEGIPVQPINRTRIYDIISADDIRGDYGRLEFWQVRAKEYRSWSVWYSDIKNRQYN